METRGVLLDLGGVLYVGDEPISGAVEAVGRLRAAGLPLRLLTNTTRRTRLQVHEKLGRLGFEVDEAEIITASVAVRRHLLAEDLRPMLLIHPELEPEFADVDQRDPNIVVLGDAGESFTYAALNRAFRLLMEGAPLLAMGANRYFRETDGLSLDAGPFVTALEYAADVEARVLGKPAAAAFLRCAEELGCAPGETVMIGDDVTSDVIGALDAGLQGILVQTGKYQDGDESALSDRPGARTVADVSAAVDEIVG